jgi:hypothetical protein
VTVRTDTPESAWAGAFLEAQKQMPAIRKDKKATIRTKDGGQFSYTYADLSTIIDAVRKVLNKHGLSFAQSVEVYEGGVAVITRIYHSHGHIEVFGPIVLPSGGDARAAGSAITYARRYALCAALGIAADEDDDASGAEPSRSRSPSNRPVPETSAPQGPSEANPEEAAGAQGAETSEEVDNAQPYGEGGERLQTSDEGGGSGPASSGPEPLPGFSAKPNDGHNHEYEPVPERVGVWKCSLCGKGTFDRTEVTT